MPSTSEALTSTSKQNNDNNSADHPNGMNNVSQTIEDVISQFLLDDSSSSDEEDNVDLANNLTWGPVLGNLKNFLFTEQNPGVKAIIYEEFYNKTPYDFYKLMVSDELINYIVIETNRYAQQCKQKNTSQKSRIIKWVDTNSEEIEKFLGIIVWMGLFHLPSIQAYWQKSFLYYNKIRSLMSRNRFQLLLKTIHFNNNEDVVVNRLHKIKPLIDKLLIAFQAAVVPQDELCIDETLVPFRGRLSFRQYIKNKRHKFGIKLFKLCVNKGYTYNLSVYCGTEKNEGQSVATGVVFSLINDLLDKGRTLYTDNYYTSVALAHALLRRNTYLVGTLRTNRKLNPKEVITKKLKKGETVSAESNTGVVVLKWKDKRDVLVLSTKHNNELVSIRQRGGEIQKPKIISDYNKCKSFIDLSDQMKAYSSSLRRGIKWYRKLAIELLLGTALVNAYILHQEVANDNISITKFKESLITQLLHAPDDMAEDRSTPRAPPVEHRLEESQGAARKRGRCVSCYKSKVEEVGRKAAVSQSTQSKFRCVTCEKYYCLPCFFKTHKCEIN